MTSQTRRLLLLFGALHLVATALHAVAHFHMRILEAGTAIALAAIDLLGTLYLAAALIPSTALDDQAGGRHIIFVDGECVFCNRLVRFILELDGGRHFHFAHLQGELARSARLRHGADPEDVDGIYLLAHEGTDREQLLVDGAAGREIWPRLLLAAMPMRLVPVPLLDVLYRAFARYRYRLFGKSDSCVVPPASIRARFLEGP